MADTIFHNGEVHGMTDHRQVSEALAIRGGRILAVGTHAEVFSHRRPDTEVIDLDGAVLLPGFHDAHLHLSGYGLSLAQLDLTPAQDTSQALKLISSAPAGDWLLGYGFSVASWGSSGMTAAALDAIWPDRPVALQSQDYHSMWLNSRALELTGFTGDVQDPPGGRIQRDGQGRPSGLLYEAAATLARNRIPEPDEAAVRQALTEAGSTLAAMGITTVHHMAFETPARWRAIAGMASSGDYPLRVWSCIPQEELEQAADIGLATGQGGSDFTIGGAKFFSDGALGSETAWMLEPYEGTDDVGVAMIDSQTFFERIELAAGAGLTPVIHAIGDAAVHETLDALEASKNTWQAAGLRPRLEHAQHILRQDVSRMADLGIIASMQPSHLTFDAPNIGRLLGKRAGQSFAFRQFLDQGVTLAFGSDTPVAPPGVLAGLRAAVRRTGLDGVPFETQESLTMDEALHAYTRGAAYAISRERSSGQLAAGFDADLVVLSGYPQDDADVRVLQTVKGGTVTHDAGVLKGA